MRHLLPLFLLCSTAMGQGFLSYQVPDLSGLPSGLAPLPCGTRINSPADIGGLAFRWVASDLTNGPVTNWIDRVQGYTMSQSVSANRPTKDANGVNFSTNSLLNLTNVINFPFDSWYMVVKLLPNVTGFDQYPFSSSVGFLGAANTIQLFTTPATGKPFQWAVQANPADIGGNLAKAGMQTNTFFDVVWSVYPPNMTWYTNSVPDTNSIGTTGSTNTYNLQVFGNAGTSGNRPWFAQMQEFGIFTNKNLSTNDICSLHYTLTNTYGFTP